MELRISWPTVSCRLLVDNSWLDIAVVIITINSNLWLGISVSYVWLGIAVSYVR